MTDSAKFEQRHSSDEDVPGDPMNCVIAREIKRQFPWARHVTVGRKTIRLYDYRCPHNPEGLVGVCSECPGRKLVWATPLRAAQAINDFDRTGEAEFPVFHLREEEAQIIPATQDKARKRQAMAEYRVAVMTGERKPKTKSAKARVRNMMARRRS